MAAHLLTQLSHLPPAALLAVIIVCVLFAALALAPLFTRRADDCGLKLEGTYTRRIRRHNGRQ